jgi:uncharacterized membrane protein YbhN (UPF0104 family)
MLSCVWICPLKPPALLSRIAPVLKRLKPHLRWLWVGAAIFFLLATLRDRAAEVAQLRLAAAGWRWLAAGLGLTAAAHLWAGWVWGWLLGEFGRPAPVAWVFRVYLQTNIAKYLPGNVWHFYGRIEAARSRGYPWGIAALSVLLEPLLMAVGALLLGLAAGLGDRGWLQGAIAIAILGLIHPKILNPIVQRLGRSKLHADGEAPFAIARYPWRPFLGECGFLILRGAGFLACLGALSAIAPGQILPTLSAFGLAWLAGLVVPGAPGGIGVFEATAIALLDGQISPAILLGTVVIYRFISILIEATLAAIAWAWSRRVSPTS